MLAFTEQSCWGLTTRGLGSHLALLRGATGALSHWHSLPDHPVLAGVSTQPYRAYAFPGHADSVNASDTLSADDVRNGTYDVFIVDAAMRSPRVRNGNPSFSAAFVADPASLGYAELTEAFTGARDIYYRPRVGR